MLALEDNSSNSCTCRVLFRLQSIRPRHEKETAKENKIEEARIHESDCSFARQLSQDDG